MFNACRYPCSSITPNHTKKKAGKQENGSVPGKTNYYTVRQEVRCTALKTQ